MSMRDNVRKCDSCIYDSSDYRGNFCGCSKSTEYNMYSIYGWCEQYTPERKYIDNGAKRNVFHIDNMTITLGRPMSKSELDTLFCAALKGIGVIEQNGTLS